MIDQFTIGLTVLFLGVAVLTGLAASFVLTRSSTERRRIREMAAAAGTGLIGLRSLTLTDRPDDMAKRVSTIVPKSPKEMNRLQKRMVRAGDQEAGRRRLLCGGGGHLPDRAGARNARRMGVYARRHVRVSGRRRRLRLAWRLAAVEDGASARRKFRTGCRTRWTS